MMRNL